MLNGKNLYGLMKRFSRDIATLMILFTLLSSQTNFTALSISGNHNLIAHSKLHPILLNFADKQPDQKIRVIVRVSGSVEPVMATIPILQGKVVSELQIINAFVAELPAHSLYQLEQIESVQTISWDAPVQSSACTQCVDITRLANSYNRTVRASDVWNTSPYRQGKGIGVAVVDSGVNMQDDLYTTSGQNRIVASQAFNNGYNTSVFDSYGHGSHVAGVIGGNGRKSNGAYIGTAPGVNIINVKVGDDLNQGQGTASTVIAGLQWILQNKTLYNIRVVNMSLNASVDESYHTSPLNAAVEVLWFNKIVVVVSAGNAGSGAIYPPANDPFVITVGATDDKGTPSLSDDLIPFFSAYGMTSDGFAKPDLVAPGTNIVGLVGNINSGMQAAHPENKVMNGSYFRLSGTSAAAPVVTGAVALLLQDEPTLTPDQVKYRLMSTANTNWPGYNAQKAGAGYLDAYAAVYGTSKQSANSNIAASALLWTGSKPVTWSSVNWNSVNWNSVNWNSVNWNSVNWNSVNWNSDYWPLTRTGWVDTSENPLVWEENNPDQEEQNNHIFLPLVSR